MARTILVPVDGSAEGARALAVAARLAAVADLPLEAVTVTPDGEATGLERRVADIVKNRCPVTQVRSDDPVDALVRFIDARPDVIVVLGTSAKGPLSELLLGSVSEAVLSRTDHPLLLVGPHVDPAMPFGPALAVAVADDDAGALLSPAVEDWARTFGVEPWFVQVASPLRWSEQPLVEDVAEHGLVHRLAGGVRLDGVEAQWDVLHSRSTPDALIDFAGSVGGGVVAVATPRWADPGRIRWISTARSLVHRSPYPVLVVPVHRDALARTSVSPRT